MRGLRGVLLVDGGVALSFWCAETVSGALAGGGASNAGLNGYAARTALYDIFARQTFYLLVVFVEARRNALFSLRKL